MPESQLGAAAGRARSTGTIWSAATCYDAQGVRLGRVTGVEGTLDRSYLVVDGHVMIPLVGGICVAVDIAGGA